MNSKNSYFICSIPKRKLSKENSNINKCPFSISNLNHESHLNTTRHNTTLLEKRIKMRSSSPSNKNNNHEKEIIIKNKSKSYSNLNFSQFTTKKNIHHKSYMFQGKLIDKNKMSEISKNTLYIQKIEKKHENIEFPSLFKSEDFLKTMRILSLKKKSEKTSEFLNEVQENLLIINFSEKIEKSKILSNFYKGKEIKNIVSKMSKFLYSQLSVSIQESKKNFEFLERIHRPLKISDQDFDIYKGLNAITMREMGIEESKIQYFLNDMELFRTHIVYNKRFHEIFPKFKGNYENFVNNSVIKIKENGLLSIFFENFSDEKLNYHQRRIFNHILGVSLLDLRKNQLINIHGNSTNSGINWRIAFEMKNLLLNCFIELFPFNQINFAPETEILFNRIQEITQFILPKNNPYNYLSNNYINLNLLIENFNRTFIGNTFLKKLFGKWSKEKLINHNKMIINYLFNNKDNLLLKCDLIPAHCKVHIKEEEFYIVKNNLKKCLINLNCDNSTIDKLCMDFESLLHNICRESSLFTKIGGENIVKKLIEKIYVYLFGQKETQKFYHNSDSEYVKHKQKIFFCKMFQNKINNIDLTDLKAIHYKMGIKNSHFKSFITFVNEYLNEISLTNELKNNIIRRLEEFEPYICDDNQDGNEV